MRLSIVLAICFLGVASASSLVKRNFLSDLQNKTQDAFHNLEHLGQDFNQKLQDALKNLFGDHSAEKTVEKRATNPLQLVNDLKDPGKFAQDLVKILAEMALQGRRKRDLFGDLKKFADAGKQKAEDALEKLMDLFHSFGQDDEVEETSTEKTVSKRDVSEDLKKIADAGKEKVQAAIKQLHDLFEQIKGGFNSDKDSKTVTKRDIADSLKRFGQAARDKTQAALQHIKDAVGALFGKKPAPAPAKEEVAVEDSTQVSVSKRSLSDFMKFGHSIHQQTHEALKEVKNAFSNFFGAFRPKPQKPTSSATDEVEDTTQSS